MYRLIKLKLEIKPWTKNIFHKNEIRNVDRTMKLLNYELPKSDTNSGRQNREYCQSTLAKKKKRITLILQLKKYVNIFRPYVQKKYK